MTASKASQGLVSQSERRSLEKLLEEDFRLLRTDLHRMAGEAIRARNEAINEDRAVDMERARKSEDKIRQQIRALQDDGFKVAGRPGYEATVSVRSTVLEKALE